MRRLAVLLAPILWLSTARAAEVSFPLTVDYALLGRALRETLTADQTGDIVLWGTATGCRSLVLRDVAIDAAQGRARIVARGRARVGFGFLRFCFAPLSWDGYLDSLATPEVGRDWQLRFRDLDSHLYDGQHRRTIVASRLWEVVKSRVEERFEAFHFDLAPPIDEASALIRASVAPERAEPVVALAGEPHPGVDPVRQLFLRSWDRLHDVVRRAALSGTLEGRALRYATFLAAGDALAAVDAAGPSLGLEISADGLRRLARLLEPEYAGDPLEYTEESDPALRQLFDFHEPNTSPAVEPEPAAPPSAWWWPGRGSAHA